MQLCTSCRGDNFVLQDALLAVNILQVEVERHHALREALLNNIPFVARDNARHKVERKEPLRPPTVTIYGECNALDKVREIRQLATLLEDTQRHGGEDVVHRGRLRTGRSIRAHKLVIKGSWVVAFEQWSSSNIRRDVNAEQGLSGAGQGTLLDALGRADKGRYLSRKSQL